MKRVAYVLVILLCGVDAFAQKENNVWVGGWKSALDFNSGSPVPFLREDGVDFWRTNASICDNQGDLLFYSNGYHVLNKNLQMMQNGSALEIGDYESWGYEQLSIPNGALILPFLTDTTKYYLFHFDLNYTSFDTFSNMLLPTHLFYSVVDMTLDGGLGGIISGQKNMVLLADTFVASGMKAVKHANGRDYWIMFHEAFTNNYYRYLFDPYGLHGPYVQSIGLMYDNYNTSVWSQICFSKDGSLLAQQNLEETAVELYNFDRCTGELYDRRYFVVSDTAYGVTGIALSPDGQYLYATSNNYKAIWQFDVTTPDIFASRQLAAWYSGALNPFETDFQALHLGPDNKIYSHAFAYNNSLHVITNPDNPAASCGFVENAIQVNPPGWNWSGFPNTVNYSLGALVGSGCDTVTSTKPLPNPVFSFGVYPNPFTREFQISVTGVGTNALVEVSDVLGRLIYTNTFTPVNQSIHQAVDLSNVPNGVYFVTLPVNGKHRSQKLFKR